MQRTAKQGVGAHRSLMNSVLTVRIWPWHSAWDRWMTSNMKLMALLLNDVGPAGCQVRGTCVWQCVSTQAHMDAGRSAGKNAKHKREHKSPGFALGGMSRLQGGGVVFGGKFSLRE